MVRLAPVLGLAPALELIGSTSGPVMTKSPLTMRMVSVVIGLELLRNAGLLQNGVGRVSRHDGVVHGEAPAVKRAFPDLVIAPALAHETAVVIAEDAADRLAVAARHISFSSSTAAALKRDR